MIECVQGKESYESALISIIKSVQEKVPLGPCLILELHTYDTCAPARAESSSLISF